MTSEDDNAVERLRSAGMSGRAAARAAQNRWLPEGRRGPMPWIIAIIMFLTLLAAAAGLGLGQALIAMRGQLAGAYTVQVVEANPAARAAQVTKIAKWLKTQKPVRRVAVVPEQQLRDQLEPWIGADVDADELPVPALIDLDLAPGAGSRAIGHIRGEVKRIAPGARLESHQSYLAPVERLMRGLMWLAAGLVTLMLLVTGAVATLAARSAHATHRSTIDIMHLLGATDLQIARMFQRRMTLDALYGALIGSIASVIALLLIGQALAEMGSELTQMIVLPWQSATALIAVPVFGVLVAAAAARLTVTRALERSL